jgi:hypothetical protein
MTNHKRKMSNQYSIQSETREEKKIGQRVRVSARSDWTISQLSGGLGLIVDGLLLVSRRIMMGSE